MRWLHLRTVQRKMFFFIVLFLVLPSLLSFYLSDRPLEETIERKIGESSQGTLKLIKLDIENTVNEMITASTQIVLDPAVIRTMTHNETVSEYEKFIAASTIFKRIVSISRHQFDYRMVLIDRNQDYYASSRITDRELRGIFDSEWYRHIQTPPYDFTWFHYLDEDTGEGRITLGRAFTNPSTNTMIGTVLISVPFGDLTDIVNELEAGVFLLDEQGQVVNRQHAASGEETDALALKSMQTKLRGQDTVIIDQVKYMVNFDTIQPIGWKIVQKESYDSVFREINQIRTINLWTITAVFALFLVITYFISHRITRPLWLLRNKMSELNDAKLSSYIQVKGTDEIADLNAAYNRMLRQIKDLLRNLQTEQKHKENMRFKALQAQMNPHFTLNTLNNIKWMAYMRQDHEVAEMITSLAVILEGSIGRGTDEIPLAQEIEYIKSYVHLHQIKLNDKLELECRIPEELMNASVIKFSLQPLVENSISHGFDRFQRNGKVVVSAEKHGQNLIVRVVDNGQGFAEDKLLELQVLLRSSHTDHQHERLGLLNLHERMKLIYGEAYGLSIRNLPEGGCEVVVKMPWIYKVSKGG